MSEPCVFFAAGHPATKGSTRSFMAKGRMVTKGANPRTKAWQGVVAHAAHEAGAVRHEGPVEVSVAFVFARPKGHYGAKGLKPSAPAYPTTRAQGDVDKLLRAVLDGLDGVCFGDDSQVVYAWGHKRWARTGECEGAQVMVVEAQ